MIKRKCRINIIAAGNACLQGRIRLQNKNFDLLLSGQYLLVLQTGRRPYRVAFRGVLMHDSISSTMGLKTSCTSSTLRAVDQNTGAPAPAAAAAAKPVNG